MCPLWYHCNCCWITGSPRPMAALRRTIRMEKRTLLRVAGALDELAHWLIVKGYKESSLKNSPSAMQTKKIRAFAERKKMMIEARTYELILESENIIILFISIMNGMAANIHIHTSWPYTWASLIWIISQCLHSNSKYLDYVLPFAYFLQFLHFICFFDFDHAWICETTKGYYMETKRGK